MREFLIDKSVGAGDIVADLRLECGGVGKTAHVAQIMADVNAQRLPVKRGVLLKNMHFQLAADAAKSGRGANIGDAPVQGARLRGRYLYHIDAIR